MQPFTAYVICTSPRSGSTLLCKLLANTGVAGLPDSHFHEPSLEKWMGYYGIVPEQSCATQTILKQVFKAAHTRGRGTSDLFGMRMQRDSFDFFARQLKVLHPDCPDDASRMAQAFGRTLFVHLWREDKLDQAISYVKADQSGLWHKAADGTELERLSPPEEPVYDRQAIATQLAAFQQMDADWRAWFTAQNITPLQITYDALSGAPQQALARVLRALGRDPAAFTAQPAPLAKLADATNRAWAARFRSES